MEGAAVLEKISLETIHDVAPVQHVQGPGFHREHCQPPDMQWFSTSGKKTGIYDKLLSYSFLLILFRDLYSLLTQNTNHTMKINQITFLITRLVKKTFHDDFIHIDNL